MGKAKVWMAIVLLAAITAAGCGKAKDSGKDAAGDQKPAVSYMPLTVGSEWTYTGNGGGQTIEMKAAVSSVVDNGTVVTFSLMGQSSRETYKETADGLIWTALSSQAGDYKWDPVRRILSYPADSAKSWEWTGKMDTGGQSVTAHVKTKNEKVAELTVPAGTFKDVIKVSNDLNVEANGQSVIIGEVRYYGQGVGLLKQEASGPTGETMLVLELKSYKLK